jgi:hypothetical protein
MIIWMAAILAFLALSILAGMLVGKICHVYNPTLEYDLEGETAGVEAERPRNEERRYPRSKVAFPALVHEFGLNDKTVHAGMVLDLSLGGLKMSIPDGYRYKQREDMKTSGVSIVFAMPGSDRPLDMLCVPRHMYLSGGVTIMGVSFMETDFTGLQTLQNYLVN